jgi:hypothetical protein
VIANFFEAAFAERLLAEFPKFDPKLAIAENGTVRGKGGQFQDWGDRPGLSLALRGDFVRPPLESYCLPEQGMEGRVGRCARNSLRSTPAI